MQTRRRDRLRVAVAVLLWALAPAAASADEVQIEAPRALVEETVGRVLVILNQQGLTEDERRSRIEQVAFDVFDFATMSKLVLARSWKKFDTPQRKAFIHEFKRYLSRNYGSRLERYQQTDVAIVGARGEPRGDVTVLSKVVGGKFDGVEMNYRLRKRKSGEEWLVIDVVIEGVSLIANFRSQFREVLAKGGPEDLLQRMREKNAEPSSEEAEAAPAG